MAPFPPSRMSTDSFPVDDEAPTASLADCLASPGTLAILDRLPDGFAALDREWRFAFVNREAERLLGLPREALLGRRATDVFTAEQIGTLADRMRELVTRGELSRREAYSTLLGRWVESHYSRYDDGIVIHFRDITARRQSAERYQLLFTASPVPTWVYDTETLRFLAVNDAAVRLYGWSREEFMTMDISAIRPPEEREEMRRYIREMSPGYHQSAGRWRHRTRAGVDLDVEITSHSLDFDGRPARLVHVSDITERRRALEALRQSETRFRTVVESIDEGLVIADPDGRIVYANSRFARIVGWTTEELVDQVAHEILVPPAERETMRAALARRAAGERECWEMQLVRQDGTLVWVENRGMPFRDAAGAVVGTICVFADITERRRLEEELRQSQKMEAVGRLAGGIAHDFNNLLTAITNYTELLLDELDEGSALRADVREIRAAADRAASLTRQLLAFGRRQVLQPTTLEVNDVVAGLERLLRRVLGAEIVFGVSLDPGAGHVSADRGQLEQVLMNLVVNARDAMPEGGTLAIETGGARVGPGSASGLAAGDYVRIAVRDSGCGMDEATQRRVFEPFFTTKGPGEGTGLGLSTVYGIVAQSGGTVTIESAPGRGTCMTILLPRVRAAAAEPARRVSGAHATAAEPAGLGTVLLADDEESVRVAVSRILRKAGYRVLVAASGSEALGAAECCAGPIEILLTDLSMPGMNGKELAARIRAVRAETKVVLMSGHAGDQLAPGGAEDAGMVFLQKPFTMQTLLETLRG